MPVISARIVHFFQDRAAFMAGDVVAFAEQCDNHAPTGEVPMWPRKM